MSMYTPPDFYGIDDLLTDDQRLIARTVRRFVDEKVLPIIEKHNRQGTFPLHLVPELGRLGALGANLSGYGCADVGAIAYGLINLELERGDSGLRSFVSVQSSLCMWPIATYGSDEQKERWLPGMAKGDLIGCFGLTEAGSGSDPASMTTTARRDGDEFVLNGSKMWITNGSIAHVALIWAKLEEVVRGFLVDTKTPGFRAVDIHNKFSLRASVTSELVLEDVRVPSSAMLADAPAGLRGPLSCLNQARYSIVWGAVGAAMACYDEALRYAKERIQFCRPIAAYQLVQDKLVGMLTEITKAQLLAFRLGRLKETGKIKHTQVSMGKMNNVRMALEAARTAREILGAAGICDDFQCGRHLCNLESVYTYEGTHDIHKLIVGEAITGVRALDR